MMKKILTILILLCSAVQAEAGFPEPVDLGLSVRWASFNLGASAPDGTGLYFAWGETATKELFTWGTYAYCKGNDRSFTRYCNDSRFGAVDNVTVLASDDDAARTMLGFPWRMATAAEWTELWQNCNWEWTVLDGTPGYKAVSRINGASIFLPAAGHVQEYTAYDKGAFGYYWTSSAGEGYPFDVYDFYFYEGGMGVYYYARRFGFSIRPVL